MEYLCGLVVVLVAVTVIGHGIWVLLATCAREVFRYQAKPEAIRRPCPQCRSSRSVVNGCCEICGAVPRVETASREREELQTTARQLWRLHREGAISQEHFEALVSVVNSDLGRLLARESSSGQSQSISTPIASQAVAPPVTRVMDDRVLPVPASLPPPVADETPDDARIVTAEVVDAEVVETANPVEASPPPRSSSWQEGTPEGEPLNVPGADELRPLITPRRSLADVLQSFMEESNIRWGEIIAGILIVISAVGLVFSLRATLKAIPYFPALLFMLFTVAFWGAGMYTLRRWKLHAVSRVILIISLLLVPLSFSAAIVMSGSGESQRMLTDPLLLMALAIGMSVFGFVTFTTSRELVEEGALKLSIGVLGTSLSQVLIDRLAMPGMGQPQITWLVALPVVSFLIAIGGQIIRGRAWRQVSRRRSEQVFLVLGVATFALAAPLGLLLYHAGEPRETLGQLSPALSLAAGAILGLGLLVHRRTSARRLATVRMAGTAVAISGAVLMLALVTLAWPRPELLVAVGLMNCGLLIAFAFAGNLPVLHAPGMACLVVATVVGYQMLQGNLNDEALLPQWILASAVTGQSGIVLGILAAALAGSGLGLWRSKRWEDALYYFGGAGAVAALSALVAAAVGLVPLKLPLEGWQAIRDPDFAAPLLLFYAAALLILGPQLRRADATWAGAGLLWIGLVYALTFNTFIRSGLEGAHLLPGRPVFIATLLHALSAIVISTAVFYRWLLADEQVHREGMESPLWKTFVSPLSQSGAATLILATPFIVWVLNNQFVWHANYAALAMLLWCAVAALHREPVVTYLVQAMFALSVGFVIAALLVSEIGGDFWYLDVRHLHWQGIGIAGSAIVWSVLRRVTSDWRTLRTVLVSAWPAVDQLLLATVIRLTPILALVAAWPGLVFELSLGDGLLPARFARQCAFAGEQIAWIGLGATLAALAFSLWERVTLPALAGIAISLFAVPWLVATWFDDINSVASAARWTTALFGAISAAVFIGRAPLFAFFERLPALNWGKLRAKAYVFAAAQPLLFGGLPVLVLTLIAVGQRLAGVELGGPATGSLFHRLGPTVSYAGPLLVLVAMLLAYAIRERQSWYALGGSFVFQLTANLAFLLYASDVPGLIGSLRAAEWLQWNSIAAGAFGIIWLSVAKWIRPSEVGPSDLPRSLWPFALSPPALTQLQFVVAAGVLAGLVGWAIAVVIESPSAIKPLTATLGSPLSYVALALVVVLIVWNWTVRVWHGLGTYTALLLIAIVPLLAATSDSYDVPRNWLAYHVLSAGWLAIAMLVAATIALAKAAPHFVRFVASHWIALVASALVVALAIRGNAFDPLEPWWSLGMAGGVFVVATSLGVLMRSQGYAYASTLAAGLASALYWFAPSAFALMARPLPFEVWAVTLPEVVIALTGATAGLWLGLEIRSQMSANASLDARFRGPPVHHAATMVGIFLLLLTVLAVAGLNARPAATATFPYDRLPTWGAGIDLLVYATLLIAALWDRRATYAFPMLYAWGAIALFYGVNYREIPHVGKLSALLLAAAGYVALTGHLWSYGANLAVIGSRLGISDPVAGLARINRWLPALSYLATASLCVLPLPVVLAMLPLEARVAAAFAPGVAAWGLVCLAQERRRDALQLSALLLVALSGVYVGWAQIEPAQTEATWLARVFRLLMVLAGATFMYGLVVPRFLTTAGSWHASTRKAGFLSACAAIGTFVVVLALEIVLFEPGIGAPVDGVQVAAVAVVLVALIAGLISLAVLPGRDPLMLSEKGRMLYVYAAQATGVLLFVHLYVCKPMWFGGLLRPYWPFIVMAIAFISVGLSELFHRTRIRVLAEPFERTGMFLPLLPALGWWVAAGNTDYPLLLFTVGLLYVVLSVTRRSWLAAIGAVVAGNGALWALLNQRSFNFLEHPQFWLIPPAASVLVAAQLNRRRLDPPVLIAVRYICMIVIYLSSTSEIFLRGGDSLWPPMILAALAVAGAMLGIVLRIRAFLYLGSAFVLMAMISMVWHASRAIEHVWPWWAFGIGMGIAILVLFGIFEKQREEVQRLILRLRQWEQ